MKRRGVETRLVLAGGVMPAAADPVLLKALGRARRWSRQLLAGDGSTAASIARTEGITESYVAKVIRLAFLAPDITGAILAGTQPVTLTADRLIQALDLPADWAEQRALLGFAPA